MTRAQCIVYRENRILMVKHRHDGKSWWCLPGGGVERNETPAQAARRELREECCVDGVINRVLNHAIYSEEDDAYTFLVDIGDQNPQMGTDPEFPAEDQVLVNIAWLSLQQIPERDRAFLWGAGLLGLPNFVEELYEWGDSLSYPG